MAGFGARSYGRGKRMPPQSQSSSSSYFSIITLVIFLAFCFLGVWMLTTSSVVPVQVTNTAQRTFRGFVSSSLPYQKGGGDDEDARPRDFVNEGIVKDVRAGNGGEDEDETTRVEGGGDKLVVEDLASVIKLPGGEDGAQEEQVATDEGQQKEESGSEPGEAREEAKGEEQEQERVGSSEEEGQNRQGQQEGSEQGDQKIQKTEEEGGNEQQQQTTEEKPQVDEGQQQAEQTQENDGGDQGQKGENEAGEETRQRSDVVEGKPEGNDESGSERIDKVEEPEKQQDVGTDTEGRSLESEGGEPATDSSSSTTTDTDTDTDSNSETQQQSSQEQTTQTDGGDSQEGSNQDQQDRKTEDEEVTPKDQDKSDLLENLSGDSAAEKGGSTQPTDDNGTIELGSTITRTWEICNVTAGHDYIPCLDNEEALKHVHITGHYEHRERHCPDEGPTCLVSLPDGYRKPIEWPTSRGKIWYNNVPHKKLAQVKGHQNWMKVSGEHIIFPGGGTQFIHGALHYIDFIQKAVPRIAWGKHTRVILDVGCGVASFGGFLFERDVIAMSFAPKDEHEAQVQFALERGIPAISAVMGTQRLPFPSAVFDIVHCARCRVPWHVEGGRLLLELNRVLRPGGYFVWSATPVYQKLQEDVEIWNAMSTLTKSMCWDLVTIKKDRINGVGAAIFRKPVSNECYDHRQSQSPPMCKADDDANAAWYVPLQSCLHRVPIHSSERGSQWPADWPRRLHTPPYWLNKIQKGIYGKPEPDDFKADADHWKRVVEKSYVNAMGINWSKVRNVMDMRAVYGGFAAALKDMKLWVMNIVNIDSVDTLPIIFERGLFGIYHDWCESFSTYPRTYDLLHADHLFSRIKKRCHLLPVIVEVDRILRPGGTLIVRDESAIVSEVENMLKSLHWDVRLTFSKSHEGILCAEKSDWRPEPSTTAS